jgi:hypothetical protein
MHTVVMALAAVVALAIIIIAVLASRKGRGEGFDPGESMTLTWATPAYQFPADLVYDWGVCAADAPPSSPFSCKYNVGKPIDPKDPSTWPVTGSGLTSPALTLDSGTAVVGGYVLNFGVRARDPKTAPPVVGPWTFTTVDLSGSSKGTLSVLDPSGLPPVAGTAGVTISLALAPGATQAAAGHVTVSVVRPGYITYRYSAPTPLTTADEATWKQVCDFTAVTAATPWLEFLGNQGNPQPVPPGPLQAGDLLALTLRVAVPGKSAKVFYWSGLALPTIGNGTLPTLGGFGWALA